MKLTDQEKTAYMANLVHISQIDGVISPKETSLLEEFRNIHGLKKPLYNSACKVAENPSFKLVYVGNFGVQVNILSEMLYLAHIDGDFCEKESKVLESFSDGIGLTKDQFLKMIKEAESSC